MIGALRSLRPMRRRTQKLKAPRSAPAIASTCPTPTAAKPGRIMTRTPAKPTAVAVQRRQPTLSPSSGTERAVTSIGEANRMA